MLKYEPLAVWLRSRAMFSLYGIPSVAEPLLLSFDASVEFHPFMTSDDLASSAIDELGQTFA